MDGRLEHERIGEQASTSDRRRPAQKRSRERVERILAAACDSIAERGSEQMKMSDVAARSGMSIGALYRYFPDKAAIIRHLAQRYNDESRRCVGEALSRVTSRGELETAFAALVDEFLALMRAEPAMRDIWSGMQSDKSLVVLQADETKACAALLAAAMQRASDSPSDRAFALPALLIWDLGEAAVRLAMTMPPGAGDTAVAIYKRMAMAELRACLDSVSSG